MNRKRDYKVQLRREFIQRLPQALAPQIALVELLKQGAQLVEDPQWLVLLEESNQVIADVCARVKHLEPGGRDASLHQAALLCAEKFEKAIAVFAEFCASLDWDRLHQAADLSVAALRMFDALKARCPSK